MMDAHETLASVPYCAWLGASARVEDGAIVLDMPFDPKLIGIQSCPHCMAGSSARCWKPRRWRRSSGNGRRHQCPRPSTSPIDYLRAGRPVLSHARAYLARQGRRIVSARAEMWQEDALKPVASFRGHFLLANSE